MNNAQRGHGAFGELNLRSRRANGRSHTMLLPLSYTTFQKGH